MARGKGTEFEAFQCVLIDGGDMIVKVFFYLKRDLEHLEDMS